ncbi:hypothetical protein QR721_03955 [Aciduricibacillus chroicocephali]|uniref:Multidrug transporter n=1 Tax=Aciduricibacillus chroicocephali TaxID=3054939 RepID=A0ABY9KXB2_9BACI|nr:hypothetical protein QR721_03955 [Bacillaceae bacterium 44XB]
MRKDDCMDPEKQFKAKSYQETNEEIANSEELKHRQPTPQPKEMDEIEY